MTTPTDFQKDYFIQTRQEIDTDKKIRDKTLNFAVLVLGATGFVLFRSESTKQLFKSWYGLGLNVSAVIIMTSLFYARRQKMKQIADRWFTLYYLLKRNPDWMNLELTMESIVFKGFQPENGKLQRYMIKDLILNFTFCTPLLIAIFFFNIKIAILISILFIIFVCWLHLGTIKDPFEKKSESNYQSGNN